MSPVRLSDRPSVLALVTDVLVLWVALPSVWDEELPTWLRILAGCVALVAAVLGARSTMLLYRQR